MRTAFDFLRPLVPTPVFWAYWHFAAERQRIFYRRLGGATPPWTDDSILREYKFTNAFRASDRVSQYLIREVIYKGSGEPREVFFRSLLFKIFNRIETWELLLKNCGNLCYDDYSFDSYERVLSKAMERGESIYSAAYIMPSGAGEFRGSSKHQMHLRLLQKMIEDRVPEQLGDMSTMKECFETLRSYPTIGDFLAYQYTIDLNYSTIVDFSENEFVAAGPGARRGVRKCFEKLGRLTDAEAIRIVTRNQQRCFDTAKIEFPTLWGRDLHMIDCQNLFCEVDKYARVAYPTTRGDSKRKRIKQRFKLGKAIDTPWYPPKWGINEIIAKSSIDPQTGTFCAAQIIE